MEIYTKLKKARKDKKLTQEYVASQINVSRKTISSWENGHGKPNSAYLKQLNSIYDTNLQFHYTQKLQKHNNYYVHIFYFINLVLFILCLINLFTGFLTGIAAIQLIFILFLLIKYKINLFIELKNKITNIYVLLSLFLIIFLITMNNLSYTHVILYSFNDIPFYIGAIVHSLILTSSFFIISNYRNFK